MKMIDLETTLRSLAPSDLNNVPVYVGLITDGAPSQLICDGAGGITSPSLDLALKPWLLSREKWQGRGLAMVINDTYHRKENQGDDEILEASILNTCVHELGHRLDTKSLELAEADDEGKDVAEYVNRIKDGQEKTTELFGRIFPVLPWHGHGATWLRVTAHLCWRARQAGHLVSLSVAAHPDSYELSRGGGYAQTLKDECEQFANSPLLSLHDHPPPPDFMDIWRADQVRWVQSAENEEAKVERRMILLGF